MSSGHVISIELPPELYAQVQEIAAQNKDTVESVLVNTLSVLLGISDTSAATQLSALQAFSDDQLWAVIYHQLTPQEKERLSDLLDRGNEGNLSPDEKSELKSLVAKSERQMLLRSEAFVLLKERGHDIDSYRNFQN